MRPFVPSKLEAHFITVHGVSPAQIVRARELCQRKGLDYQEYLNGHELLFHLVADHDLSELRQICIMRFGVGKRGANDVEPPDAS